MRTQLVSLQLQTRHRVLGWRDGSAVASACPTILRTEVWIPAPLTSQASHTCLYPSSKRGKDRRVAEVCVVPGYLRKHVPQVQGEPLLQRNRKRVIEEATGCLLLITTCIHNV